MDWKSFETTFNQASVQRLMQALGAYGFLGYKKGKKQFQDYIPSGIANLHLAVKQTEKFPHLLKLIEKIQSKLEHQ
jgi:aminoglycoside/choline kinase family phosphotransferase